jgi:hypothetical protein
MQSQLNLTSRPWVKREFKSVHGRVECQDDATVYFVGANFWQLIEHHGAPSRVRTFKTTYWI